MEANLDTSCFVFRSNIVKEAAWTVSNVTAGNPEQIQLVIDAQILEPLIEVLVRVSLLVLVVSYDYCPG